MFSKKGLLKKFLFIFFIIFIVFAIATIYMINNQISMNRCIKTDDLNELIITSNNSSQLVINSNDDEFDTIKDILSHSKVSFYSERLLEYDKEIDTIELKNKNRSKVLYTYSDKDGNGMIIIVKDFFENKNTATQLDYPYYLISHISFSDYYKIFSNSTLLSNRCIFPTLKIKGQNFNNKTINATLYIRNDNDCSIKLDELDYKDKNILITCEQSKAIAPHSDAEIKMEIKINAKELEVEEYLKKSNFKLEFFSVENIRDRCVVSDLKYK